MKNNMIMIHKLPGFKKKKCILNRNEILREIRILFNIRKNCKLF